MIPRVAQRVRRSPTDGFAVESDITPGSEVHDPVAKGRAEMTPPIFPVESRDLPLSCKRCGSWRRSTMISDSASDLARNENDRTQVQVRRFHPRGQRLQGVVTASP